MFVFSELHPWQENGAVMQVLVFSSEAMSIRFKDAYALATNNGDPGLVSCVTDSNMGAIYKLRAVKNVDCEWIPVIRCGFTGGHLMELDPEPTAQDAIEMCKGHLALSINKSIYG